jgi:hypothetical protein
MMWRLFWVGANVGLTERCRWPFCMEVKMKKTAENRYPNSATLFKFCKEALEIRYDGNVKVIDQDVGAILGYDPADCSHWKKGKKNIRALGTLRSIADHLHIDERLLIDIASGKIGLDEAVFEFKGYGSFSLQGRHLESLKKEFFRNPSKWQQEGSVKTFEDLFDVNRQAVSQVAASVLQAGNFTEAPIYIPELMAIFPNLNIVADDQLAEPILVETQGEGSNIVRTIKFRGPDMKPYVRFLLAREIFKYLVASGAQHTAVFSNIPSEVLDIQANIFAGMLLVPASMIKAEVEKIDGSMDLVAQLADTFWVSKSLMNQRLRDYMENLS